MMINEVSKNNNKKYSVFIMISIIIVLLLLASGTYAFLSDDFGATNGNYAYNTACFDITYDVTNEEGTSDITGTLIPSVIAKRGLGGSVSIGLETGCKTYAYGDIFLNISSVTSLLTQTVAAHCENIVTLETMSNYTTESECVSQSNGIWVTDGAALKYAVYKESKNEPISVGYINSSSEKINIYQEFNIEEKIAYDIYIWLDGNLIDNTYTSLSFGGNISASVTQVEAPLPEKPDLDQNGMIPVTISAEGIVTTIDKDDNEWYNYANKEWANAILVSNSSRGTYRGTSGVTVSKDDILAYYVWVPRYKYEVWTTGVSGAGSEQSINIKFENLETLMSSGTTIGLYRTHPAFWWDDDSDGIVDAGETIGGIWVGKFETSANTNSVCYTSEGTNNCLPANLSPRIVPNVKSLRYQTISNQFATSQKFSVSGNSYGLSGASIDAHMMKNSEWGAVAYLSHSVYGINQEIYINNSSNYITGRSGGGVGSDDLSSTTYGNYTWLGESVDTNGNIGSYASDRTLGTNASTTGNATGVYDMSGGAWEYVMGNYDNTSGSSDFTIMPDSKYYDLYSIASISSCTLSICGGATLNETANWYFDYSGFASSGTPWFAHGGNNGGDEGVGVFALSASYGGNNPDRSWRSVLVVA